MKGWDSRIINFKYQGISGRIDAKGGSYEQDGFRIYCDINSNNEGIEREVFEANLAHAVAIYQSFKYLILACAVGATFKGLYLAVKNFARSGPYN